MEVDAPKTLTSSCMTSTGSMSIDQGHHTTLFTPGFTGTTTSDGQPFIHTLHTPNPIQLQKSKLPKGLSSYLPRRGSFGSLIQLNSDNFSEGIDIHDDSDKWSAVSMDSCASEPCRRPPPFLFQGLAGSGKNSLNDVNQMDTNGVSDERKQNDAISNKMIWNWVQQNKPFGSQQMSTHTNANVLANIDETSNDAASLAMQSQKPQINSKIEGTITDKEPFKMIPKKPKLSYRDLNAMTPSYF